MHQEQHFNGDLIRRIIQADRDASNSPISGSVERKLARLHAQALSDPSVRSITQTKLGRNDRCPCGSGRKFKKCCLPGSR